MLGINMSNVETAGTYPRPNPGGYVIEITSAVNNKDNQNVEIEFDIAEGDFAGYYKDMEERCGWHTAKFKKSYKPSALAYLKQFIQVILDSNNNTDGLVIGDFEDIDESKLVGMKLGMVVGEEEYIGRDALLGSVKKVRLDFFHATFTDVETIRSRDYTVPEFKPLQSEPQSDIRVIDTTASFGPLKDEDVPF